MCSVKRKAATFFISLVDKNNYNMKFLPKALFLVKSSAEGKRPLCFFLYTSDREPEVSCGKEKGASSVACFQQL